MTLNLWNSFNILSSKKKPQLRSRLNEFVNNAQLFFHHSDDDCKYPSHVSQLYVGLNQNVALIKNINPKERARVINYHFFDFENNKHAVLWFNKNSTFYSIADIGESVKAIDYPVSTYNRMHESRMKHALNFPSDLKNNI